MSKPDLLEFLQQRMSMTDVYQPVIIKDLLLHEGTRTKAELAASLAAYDRVVQEYYERIVMRWPKITLTKHGIIDYERNGSLFRLLPYPEDSATRLEALRVCEEKIADWLQNKKSRERAPEASASVRYEVLKQAGGKCQLCGISAEVRPIDIDHIVPRSRADKNGKVRLHCRLIDVNDRQNLQALCFACNRAKRDSDQTDFRRREKLVRDRIPEIIAETGRTPEIKELRGEVLRAALYDKLSEEHAELLQAKEVATRREELADLIEVALALGAQYGLDEAEMLALVRDKRARRGGFEKGYFYKGDR
jgi:predicted house-cleaning noncanonical NTP pyrophosphatase (MazG superfamily)